MYFACGWCGNDFNAPPKVFFNVATNPSLDYWTPGPSRHPVFATVLDGHFTTVQQAIGTPRSRADGGMSLRLERWVEEAKASGLVVSLIEKHGVVGKLSVAS